MLEKEVVAQVQIETSIERYINAHNDIAKAFALKYYDYELD